MENNSPPSPSPPFSFHILISSLLPSSPLPLPSSISFFPFFYSSDADGTPPAILPKYSDLAVESQEEQKGS